MPRGQLRPINSDEVPVFDYNDTGEAGFEAEPTGNELYEPNRVRTSDHDPIVIDVNLCPTHGSRANACRLRNLLPARVALGAAQPNSLPAQRGERFEGPAAWHTRPMQRSRRA
jgi:hypothetical protein